MTIYGVIFCAIPIIVFGIALYLDRNILKEKYKKSFKKP
jgi:hypothetical protein